MADQPTPTTLVARPPKAKYEIRTRDGSTYEAVGDVIEQGDGWFTLWADDMTVAIRLPEAELYVMRHVDQCWRVKPPNTCDTSTADDSQPGHLAPFTD